MIDQKEFLKAKTHSGLVAVRLLGRRVSQLGLYEEPRRLSPLSLRATMMRATEREGAFLPQHCVRFWSLCVTWVSHAHEHTHGCTHIYTLTGNDLKSLMMSQQLIAPFQCNR